MARVLIQGHPAPCQSGARRHTEKRGLILLGMHTVYTHSTIISYIQYTSEYWWKCTYKVLCDTTKFVALLYVYYSTSIYECVVLQEALVSTLVSTKDATHGIACVVLTMSNTCLYCQHLNIAVQSKLCVH
jgi:hypothetical protein